MVQPSSAIPDLRIIPTAFIASAPFDLQTMKQPLKALRQDDGSGVALGAVFGNEFVFITD